MSSIYRKGRDGYYYYQTYVINPETGKKDKRIFHSLNTKDDVIAKEKQKQLDDKYENKNPNNKKKVYNWIKKQSKTPTIIIFTVLITLYISSYFEKIIKKQNKTNNLESSLISKEKEIKIEKTNLNKKQSESFNETPISNNFISQNDNNVPIPKTPQIPPYKIQRLERLSGSFDQGKIYITVDKNSKSKDLQFLCETVMKDYSEFSNIVICLYSSDSTGIKLANGNDKMVNIEGKVESWLAMYTYNVVEGAYFNDNPTGYLGFNN